MWPFHFRKWEKRGIPQTPEQVRAFLKARGVRRVPFMRDSRYRAISHSDFMELVAKYRLNDGSYIVNVRDCDKYAIFFQADILRAWADCSNGEEALAFGYIQGTIKDDKGEVSGHAWIWQLDDKGVLWFLHGQTNIEMKWEILNLGLATG